MHHRDTYTNRMRFSLGTHLKLKLCSLTFSYHPFEFVDVCLLRIVRLISDCIWSGKEPSHDLKLLLGEDRTQFQMNKSTETDSA
jgi:hypothetical protein